MSGLSNTVRFGRFRLFGRMESHDEVLFDRFAAIKEGQEKKVEIRILGKPTKKGAPLTKRFIHELKLLSSISHPSIVSVLEVGYAEGRAFFTTPFRPSLTLARYVEKRGDKFTIRHVVKFASILAEALSALHRKKVIHRTLSTESVYVDVKKREPYIGECSAIRDLRRESVSAYGVPQLAALVEAPEQIMEEDADERTDVYLLSAVVYWLVTGAYPLLGPNKTLVTRHPKGGLVPLVAPSAGARVQGVDERFDDIILRGLSYEPADRYATAMELGAAFKSVVDLVSPDESTELKFEEEILPLKKKSPRRSKPSISVPSLPREKRPTYRLFSQKQIFLISLLSGVWGGILLMAINFRRLHFREDVFKTLFAGLVLTFALVFITTLVTPYAWASVLPIAIIIYYVTGAHLGPALQKHQELKGAFAPWWQLPFMTFFAALCTVIMAFGTFEGAKHLRPNHIVVGTSKVVFAEGVKREKAEKLAKSLKDQGYFDEAKNAVVVISVADGRYAVKASKKVSSGKKQKQLARRVAADVFGGKKFAFSMKNVKPSFKPLRLMKIGGNRLYYNEMVPHSAARRAADFFENVGLFVPFSRWVVKIERLKGRYNLFLRVRKGLWNEKSSVDYFAGLSRDLSKNVFQEKPVDLHIGDEEDESRRVISG